MSSVHAFHLEDEPSSFQSSKEANAFAQFATGEQEAAESLPAISHTAVPCTDDRHTLRRTGMRPYVFEGSELVQTMSTIPGVAFWYDISVYRSDSVPFILDVKLFYKAEQMPDRYAVYEFETLDELAGFLEDYDAAQDIHPTLPGDADAMAASDYAIHVCSLRLRVEEARGQFRDLTGELLHTLSLGY